MSPDISWIDINAISILIVDGFWAGALIGAIIGAITWTVTERGSTIVFILSVAFIIGLIVGLYVEGGAFIDLLSAGRDDILESSDFIRRQVFASLVGIAHWIFAFLAVGSIVASSRRALLGALLGGVIGTVCGMTLILFIDRMVFTMDNPLAEVLIAVASMLFLTLLALNQAEN